MLFRSLGGGELAAVHVHDAPQVGQNGQNKQGQDIGQLVGHIPGQFLRPYRPAGNGSEPLISILPSFLQKSPFCLIKTVPPIISLAFLPTDFLSLEINFYRAQSYHL